MMEITLAIRRIFKTAIVALAVLVLLPTPSRAASWWDKKWTGRKKVTVDTTATGAVINDPIGGATVLVRLFEGNFAFTDLKADASDLRFAAEDDKTLLPFHLEKIDPVMGEAFVWVRVPEVKPSGKTNFWIY